MCYFLCITYLPTYLSHTMLTYKNIELNPAQESFCLVKYIALTLVLRKSVRTRRRLW